MMRGEYYAPPPAPPKPVEKIRRKRTAAPRSAPPMADILPPEDYGASTDMFGFTTAAKKDESEDDKQ